ncbi:MFS transporter [Arthrobacter sp. APC 3897]|uniref:MFS transporter n=1 Tax=Arthrobacter sp. APC 3897 TaxID=3035204 RepID=UPI0025B33175|nr:MFS transporter [Arthrobacter sp. APC 3897]MDN3481093.1 MFS transporter [Arthrobacter sp. APC 3897]
MPKDAPTLRRPVLRRRRLKVDDVNVVNKSMMKKAVGGTVVGNTMEWFDIGVYGYLAVTMGAVFLSEADASAQLIFSLGVFAATFLARPLGGVVFGRLGDRLGRQKTLAVTLMLMAGSTFVIGLLPGYAQIGMWAPILLILMKLLQGFSTGGEYAGATTFVTEYAPDKRRGFLSSILDLGSYMGFALGAGVVSVLQLTLSAETMLDWGWRIPFLVAGPLGLIAIYFRLKIEESPAFQATLDAQEANAASENPDGETAPPGTLAMIGLYWRPIIVAMVLVAAANTVGYTLTSYMPSYLTDSMGYDALHGTLLTIPVLVAMALCIPLCGKLSDRIGRRPVLLMGAGSTIVLAVPAFLLIANGPVWSTLLGLGLLAVPVTLYVSNLASALPALFTTASRYGAMGISYNFAVAIFGGTAPLIMQGLINLTGNELMPAFWLMATSAVGAVAVYIMKESANRPMPGSMPSVETHEEARELVATQDENPRLDVAALPFGIESAAESKPQGN